MDTIPETLGASSRRIKYSVCIIHYNDISTIRGSLESIVWQLPNESEIIVVDNRSSDGSQDLLREYAARGMIRLISESCSRGVGRQLAFEHSVGEYVISQIDMDESYRPVIRSLIKYYHVAHEGMMLVAPGFSIAPRRLIEKARGWRDLQWGEDRDLWYRVAKMGCLRYLSLGVTVQEIHNQGSGPQRVRYVFEELRDGHRIGTNQMKARLESRHGLMRIASWAFLTPIDIAARIASRNSLYADVDLRTFRLKDYRVSNVPDLVEEESRSSPI